MKKQAEEYKALLAQQAKANKIKQKEQEKKRKQEEMTPDQKASQKKKADRTVELSDEEKFENEML